MNSPTDTLKAFTSAAADAVAREIATLRREAQRERELREAEHRARLAELETRVLSAAEIERQLSARLAELRDGTDGRDGIDGKDGVDGTNGRDGLDGAHGKDGRDGIDGKDGVGIDDIDARVVDDTTFALSFTRGDVTEIFEFPLVPGRDGKDGLDGRDGERGPEGPAGRDGAPGERGSEGPAGKLGDVRAWEDRVHYEGDLVEHNGSTFQAARDTSKEPPHDDWRLIASAGRDGSDGRSFAVRGTWLPDGEYSALDVVALNGSSFVAKVDSPGPCPGEGWQLVSSRGKAGPQGERGVKGDRGPAGPQVVSLSVDDNGLMTLTNGDGSQVQCDLYPLLSKL